MKLDPEDHQAIARELARAEAEVWMMRSPLVSREEAMAYVRIKSLRSWFRFCRRNHLTPLPGGTNYSREKVERAARHEEKTAA
jgi:hypothetical protein